LDEIDRWRQEGRCLFCGRSSGDEVVLAPGRFVIQEHKGKKFAGFESEPFGETSYSVILVDLPEEGEQCIGTSIQWSELMSREDRRKLMSFEPGEKVELVLRRVVCRG